MFRPRTRQTGLHARLESGFQSACSTIVWPASYTDNVYLITTFGQDPWAVLIPPIVDMVTWVG